MAQTKAQLLGPVVGDVVMDVSTLSLDAEGNKVGIGHSEPDLTLHVSGVDGLPSTSGSTSTGHLTLRDKATSTKGMFFGVSNASPFGSWIQAQDSANNATNYPLLLNPNGGNVGVGVSDPRYTLDVHGGNLLVSGSAAGNLILEDRAVADGSRPFTVLQSDGGYFNINRSNRNASGTTTSSALALRIAPDGQVRIGTSGGDIGILNVHTETDGNLHVRDIASVTGSSPAGSGVVLDVLNDASNTIKDLGFRGATTIFRNVTGETLRITSDGKVGIGTVNPTDDLSILASPNSLVIGCKDSTRTNHIFQLLADDPAGNGELRLYKNSATGTHEKTVEIAASGNSYINSGSNFGIGTANPVGNLEVRDSKANLIVAKDGLTVKSNSDLHTSYDMLQIGAGGALASYSVETATADTQLIHNAYRHSGGTFKYRYADTAMRLRMNSPGGAFIFESAANGSADGDITFSEKLRIDSAGNTTLGYAGSSLHFQNGFNNSTARIQNGGGSNNSELKFLVKNAGTESEKMRLTSTAGLAVVTAGSMSANAGNETLYIQGEGHNGHGTGNTRSVVSIIGALTSNPSGIGIWMGARTNENTAVIGTRTANGNLAFETYSGGWAERMRLLNTGQLIVGGSTLLSHPNMDDLQVGNASGNKGLTICSGTTGFGSVCFGDSSDGSGNDRYEGFVEYYHNDDSMRLGTAHTEKFRINSDGNVGINQNSPSRAKLHVVGPGSAQSEIVAKFKGGTGTNAQAKIALVAGYSDTSNDTEGHAFIYAERNGNGNAANLVFSTFDGSTVNSRLTISSGGTLLYSGEAKTVASGNGSARRVLVTPAYEEWHFTWSGASSRTATFTCTSYFHAEVTYVSHQTNGGTNIHRYIRGKWANNHTHHEWNVFEDNGNTWGISSLSISASQNGGNTASGKLTISETYGGGSVSTRAVIMRIYYGWGSLGHDIA